MASISFSILIATAIVILCIHPLQDHQHIEKKIDGSATIIGRADAMGDCISDHEEQVCIGSRWRCDQNREADARH